ncbi:uncharacterized protein LOC112529489 isoform X2 [Cynara cardunculus var. scolymus]|uniref:uncharacterized protein LOC112529489 isoform X2 n=1 Tax=Cynara cardunculus var. scolymus TaxID=59895 RepID=UPI000D62810E|nr:uncharacterized protein LOC112529489 isoform X2 [Cynara cardunculus var. scolymus]
MDVKSQLVDRSELKLGDHLYVCPDMQTMGDAGIVIGEDKIIHYVNPVETGGWGCLGDWCTPFMSSTSGSNSGGGDGHGKERKKRCPISYCGQEKVAGSRVRLSCIDCFINEQRFLSQLSYESDPPEEVIDRATYLYENWCSKYTLKGIDNDKDFAIYCKIAPFDIDGLPNFRSINSRGSKNNLRSFAPADVPLFGINRPKKRSGVKIWLSKYKSRLNSQ